MSDNAMLLLQALTALHPGAGTSVGAIDMPVQRERHTGWPMVQGSGIKGVLRAAYRDHLKRANGDSYSLEAADSEATTRAIFGPPSASAGDHGGALAVTDAAILLFPARSAAGVFALVTCPLALERLNSALEMAGMEPACKPLSISPDCAGRAPGDSPSRPALAIGQGANARVILEDLVFTPEGAPDLVDLATWLEKHGLVGIASRLVLVSDDAFGYLVKFATTVETRVKLNYDTKTVANGALFVEELLPPQTVLYSVLLAEEPHDGGKSQLKRAGLVPEVSAAIGSANALQIGGDETIGKGWCRAGVAR